MISKSPTLFPTFQSGENLDVFGRQRFSSPVTIFDSKQIVDKQPLFWDDQVISGSGGASTYNSFKASTTLSVSATTACYRARQTFRRFNYQPGKSQLVMMSMVIGASGSGIDKRWGFFDGKDPFSNNGIYWKQTNGTLGLGITNRGMTSETLFNQSGFNIDKLDGSGAAGGNPSGYNINLANSQIFFIDFQWLGVGLVRFGIVVGNKIIYCHQIEHVNLETQVYMSTPNLPLRVEIENDGTGAADSITHICATVISEGGVQETGFALALDRGATTLTTLNDANEYPLIAMRLKSTHKSANIDIKSITALCTSTSAYRWMLLLNPTVTGTAFSFSGITNSAIEADAATSNATTVSGGILIASGYQQAANESSLNQVFPNKLSVGSNIAGTSDVLVLAVQRLQGTTESFYGGISWNETI